MLSLVLKLVRILFAVCDALLTIVDIAPQTTAILPLLQSEIFASKVYINMMQLRVFLMLFTCLVWIIFTLYRYDVQVFACLQYYARLIKSDVILWSTASCGKYPMFEYLALIILCSSNIFRGFFLLQGMNCKVDELHHHSVQKLI